MARSNHPKTIRVSSRNNVFQHAEVLKRNREKRGRAGEFLVEGVAQISLAIEHGWEISMFLFGSAPLSDWAASMLERAAESTRAQCSDELLAELSDKDETSELLAIVRMRKYGAEAIPLRPDGLILVFDRPASPGNLGSSIRSAEAFGVDGIIITGHAVDMYDPHVVRGSMGTIFSVPIVQMAGPRDIKVFQDQARERGVEYAVVGSSGKAPVELPAVDCKGALICVLGNETVGMAKGYWEICSQVVKIPLLGRISSLNVSCAATVLLYEVLRQRGFQRSTLAPDSVVSDIREVL